MEEVLISIAQDTPTLALLGVVLFIVFKMQRDRDKESLSERTTTMTTFSNSMNRSNDANEALAKANTALLKEVEDNAEDMKHFIRIVDEAHDAQMQAHLYQQKEHESQMQAHLYQQKEHERMIQVLERLNGK